MPRDRSASSEEDPLDPLGPEAPSDSSDVGAPPRIRRRRLSSSSSSSSSPATGVDEAPEAAGGGTPEGGAEADALGFSVPGTTELSLRTVEDRPITLRLNEALLRAYFSRVLAPGQWERRTRKDFAVSPLSSNGF